ncbi:MAG TPA: sugar transferase [Burkholderiaceae bacterium]|nr:sugar transferase [Burkholderiaceae bacterium]
MAAILSLSLQLHEPSRGEAWGQQLHTLMHQVLAAVLLLLLWPLMVWAAWRIWRHDGAPVLFAHYRVGRHGKLFRCLKFRTMHHESQQRLAQVLANDPMAREQWQRDQKLADDPRVTPVGRFLRQTSLDELPQLINVLRGEMRLVGPRPITVGELTRYGSTRWHYLSVWPGMTGLWQVSGRNETSYAQRVALDRRYVEQHTLAMDLRILLRTVKVVLRREGAR